MKKEIVADVKLVARCGLYCGACGAYLNGRCPGCAGNDKASWCKVRSCCAKRSYASCADCTEFADPRDCARFHNVMSRIIGFVLRSDRRACVLQIREKGLDGHARIMAESRRQSIRR
ncbi:MAG: DUF3795 domain-containing protein [Deltaproteobacteria bacterium]|nr:DUF3795 domain-containing protein [Deltaproteobacteria bacterium]